MKNKTKSFFLICLIIFAFALGAVFVFSEPCFTVQPAQSESKILQQVDAESIIFLTVPLYHHEDSYKLLLVNEEYSKLLEEGAKKIVPAYGRVPLSTSEIQLEEETLLQAEKMFTAAAEAGITNLVVTSGYRIKQEQEKLYREAKNKKYVARPGTSEHELGLALDIQVLRSITALKTKRWLAQHAHKYGFIMRYPQEKVAHTGKPYEPWHYRYVGNPHAAVIYESGFCLEEYIAALEPGNFYQAAFAGKKYLLYRVKAQGNYLPVPQGRNYWFSSDGTGHYIVTAEIGLE